MDRHWVDAHPDPDPDLDRHQIGMSDPDLDPDWHHIYADPQH